MENTCFNYIKLYKGPINEILAEYFNLPENLMKFNEDEQGYIGGHRYNAAKREVTFISSGGPPIMMYSKWMNQFRGLEMEYEFHQAEVGVCGHGLIAAKMHAHTAITYSSLSEYEDAKEARDWTYPLWNGFYENGSDADELKGKIEAGKRELRRIVQARLFAN
jgi:hypothetical protein